LEQNGQGSLALLSSWLLLKVLEVKVVEDFQNSLAPNDSDRKQAIANK
jgi:hypothetical protein